MEISGHLKGVDTAEPDTHRRQARRHHSGLWRIYDDVSIYPDTSLSRCCRRVRHLQLAELYGENSIDQWMVPFFGASVYDDPPSTLKFSH